MAAATVVRKDVSVNPTTALLDTIDKDRRTRLEAGGYTRPPFSST
jgi:hypothetical protein